MLFLHNLRCLFLGQLPLRCLADNLFNCLAVLFRQEPAALLLHVTAVVAPQVLVCLCHLLLHRQVFRNLLHPGELLFRAYHRLNFLELLGVQLTLLQPNTVSQLLHERFDLLALAYADRAAFRVIAARSAYTMDVLVDVLRSVEEDNDLDVLQIQTSSRQVRGDEEASLARVELVELGVALGLRKVR